jgi:hypothetical protein
MNIIVTGPLCGKCPFVRYDTHGCVIEHSCSCARTGKELENSTKDPNELVPVRSPECRIARTLYVICPWRTLSQ